MHTLLNRVLTKLVVADQRLRYTSKLVYLGMRAHRKTTQAGHAKSLSMPVQTVARAMKELVGNDWVYSYPCPVSGRLIYVPWMPLDVEIALAKEVERLASTAPNRGEFLMKAILDIIVDDSHILDNHRFDWLASAPGDGRRELDRLLPEAKVAIEFQGRQHFEEVQFRTGKSNLQEQLARDRAKMLACERKGIAFVEVADIELSYETLVEKLDALLPLIQPRKDRPLFQILQDLCLEHASWARGQRQHR